MAAAKTMHVRNMRTDEIRKVTPEQRELQDKGIWVLITGEDVKPTPPAATVESSDKPDAGTATPKTTPKASAPKE
ncbi:hypothetical protein KK103_11945 [Curtobacterium flaccumfaciens pv. flaccumfaciens]|uniref:Uncharacterized protein n=1 Tax=Curtobacterium flaccumfaciens pv. flaccumfaciens TaxID=138532 RepID=A0A9Q2W335_9MICO|nr:hypothetical protein [Curtobacterium flaccumfaciens]MBT1542477.1 hypothetical protein [Curtobacterium flaccumfaciens pv. flaccumfaciens]